jgi:hypothetical protein
MDEQRSWGVATSNPSKGSSPGVALIGAVRIGCDVGRRAAPRVTFCTLYRPDGTVAARVERPAPAPDKIAHAGVFYARKHRLPSGWAYEVMA